MGLIFISLLLALPQEAFQGLSNINHTVKKTLERLSGVGLYSGIQALVKLLANFVLGKLSAVYLGTAGFALFGQFQNIVVFAQNLSNAGIQSGLIHFTAQGKGEGKELGPLFRTAFSISILASLVLGVLLFAGMDYLNAELLGLEDPFWPFACLVLALVFFALNLFMISVFSGFKDLRSLAIFQIIQSLSMLGLFALFIHLWGLAGAMYAISLYAILTFFIGRLYFRKQYAAVFSAMRLGWDRAYLKDMGSYASMGLLTIAASSISMLWLRTYLIEHVSQDVAGLWEGLQRISNFYIAFLAIIFTSYVLPRYSESGGHAVIRTQVWQNLGAMSLLLTVMLSLVYLLRTPLVSIVFSQEFLPLTDALHYHLLGDGLKVMGWVLSYVLVALKKVRLFIVNEIIYFAFLIWASTTWASDLLTMAQAYALSGAVYFTLLSLIVFSILYKHRR